MNLSIPALLVILRRCDIREAELALAQFNILRAGTAQGFFGKEGDEMASMMLEQLKRGAGIKPESPFRKLLRRVKEQFTG